MAGWNRNPLMLGRGLWILRAPVTLPLYLDGLKQPSIEARRRNTQTDLKQLDCEVLRLTCPLSRLVPKIRVWISLSKILHDFVFSTWVMWSKRGQGRAGSKEDPLFGIKTIQLAYIIPYFPYIILWYLCYAPLFHGCRIRPCKERTHLRHHRFHQITESDDRKTIPKKIQK